MLQNIKYLHTLLVTLVTFVATILELALSGRSGQILVDFHFRQTGHTISVPIAIIGAIRTAKATTNVLL